MARLTWQNIVAPNFSDAVQAMGLSGQLLSQGTGDISKILSGRADRRDTEASTAAMSAAMRVRDVRNWDQMMKAGGLASLGLDPSQATPEFMDFLRNQRQALSDDRADDLTYQRNQTNLETDRVSLDRQRAGLAQDGLNRQRSEQLLRQGEYAFGREQELDGRTDLQYQRSEEEYRLNQDLLAQQAQAVEVADDLANTTMSRDEALRAVRDRDDITAQQKDVMIEAISNRDESYWSVAPEFQGASNTQAGFQAAREQIDAQSAARMRDYNSNETLRYYIDGSRSFEGAQSAGKALAERLHSQKDENGNSLMKTEPGRIANLVNSMSDEFGLPESLVAQVLNESVKSAGTLNPLRAIGDAMGGGNSQIEVDESTARKTLERLSEDTNLLESQKNEIDRFVAQRDADVGRIDRLSNQYEIELSRGGDGSRTLSELNRAGGEITTRESIPGMTPAPRNQSMPNVGGGQIGLPNTAAAPIPAGPQLGFGDLVQRAGIGLPETPSSNSAPSNPGRREFGIEDALYGRGSGWDQYVNATRQTAPQRSEDVSVSFGPGQQRSKQVSAVLDKVPLPAQAKAATIQSLEALSDSSASLSVEERRGHVQRLVNTIQSMQSLAQEENADPGIVEAVNALLEQFNTIRGL